MIQTLAYASLDGALIVAAVWLVTRAMRLSPATRTLLWWCAAAKFLLALVWTTPIELAVLPAVPLQTTVVASSDSAPATPLPSLAIDANLTQADLVRDALREWASFATLAWTGGVCLVGFVAVRRWRDTSRVLARAVAAPGDVQQTAAAIASRIGLKRAPDVRISDAVQTPLVAGLRRPVVVLPAARFATLTSRQQELAICHELTHVKRADLWLGCVPALTERLFFFHPLAHLVSREYSLAREAACDAAVVEALDAAPREYGCLLLALGVSRPQAGAAAGAAWSFLHLKRRIAMLQELSSRTTRSRALAAVAVAAVVLALVPLRLVARPAEMPAKSALFLVASPERGVAAPAPVSSSSELPAQERGERSEPSLRFVLLDEGQQTVSGSSGDLERARRQQWDGEPLLWFQMDGREYVIRDRDVIRQAREAWRSINEKHIERLVGSSHLDAMRQLGVDSGLAAEAGAFGAQMGALGAQIGAMAGEIVADTLKDFSVDLSSLDHLKDLEHLKDFEHIKDLNFDAQWHNKDLEREFAKVQKDLSKDLAKSARDADHAMRDLHEQLRRDLHHSLKQELSDEIEHHRHEIDGLKDRLRALEGPIREMTEPLKDLAAPLADMGREMGDLGREIGDRTREAMEEMREIIERALKAGRAHSIK